MRTRRSAASRSLLTTVPAVLGPLVAMLASCQSNDPAPDVTHAFGPSAARAAQASRAPEIEPDRRVITEADEVLLFLSQQLALSNQQEGTIREALELDRLRKKNRLLSGRPIDSILPEDSEAPGSPEEPEVEPPNDLHQALASLDGLTLDTILRNLQPRQTDRYMELLGEEGIARIRELTLLRLETQEWLATLRKLDPGDSRNVRPIDGVLASMDANGNGVLEPAETPVQVQKFFGRLDTNGDGALDGEELEGARRIVEAQRDPRRRGRRPPVH